jgi:hypothetical protein
MQGSAWIKLIRRIPENQHDNLVAVTTAGAEIMVQRIILVEEEAMIFRGRPAGSTDQPRILLMPFDQLNHLAFHRAPTEVEVQAIFGDGNVSFAPAASALKAEAAAAAPEAPAAAPAATQEKPAPPQPAPTPSTKSAPPSKSVLLARLRARLAGDSPRS